VIDEDCSLLEVVRLGQWGTSLNTGPVLTHLQKPAVTVMGGGRSDRKRRRRG